MTTGAWIYMFTVWAAILALNIFCFARAFKQREQKPPQDNNGH